MMICNICHSPLGNPIYKSFSPQSLTSLCETRSGSTRVWHCKQCSHLRNEPLADNDEYYESDYKILLSEDDEDQIYEAKGEQIVYRTEHQVNTLLAKIELKEGSLYLDYGCAKASTPRALFSERADLNIHLFDVSSMYTSYWQQFVSEDRIAIHKTPDSWQKKFQLITSFFALEHIPSPLKTIEHVASLLDEDGTFYGIVPNTFTNVADFIVIDHVNHFTEKSLFILLQGAGFKDIHIDTDIHRGALVFTAKLNAPQSPLEVPFFDSTDALNLAQYWTNIDTVIHQAENLHQDKSAAIYGSGFYGSYIANTLKSKSNVQCFLDASPFQQGKELCDLPIIAPEKLSASIDLLYVGLNPVIARSVIENSPYFSRNGLTIIYLEGEENA